MFRINHAILHVFDFTSCVNIFSQAELDLESKQVKQYITKHVRKGLTHIDNKRGNFPSTVHSLLNFVPIFVASGSSLIFPFKSLNSFQMSLDA